MHRAGIFYVINRNFESDQPRMLRVTDIRNNKEELHKRLELRNFNAQKFFDDALALDDKRKETQTELDNLLAGLNQASKEIGELYKKGETEEAEKKKSETASNKESAKSLGEKLHQIEDDIKATLVQIPNAPDLSVPQGKSSEDNEIVKECGELPKLSEDAMPINLPYW